MRQGGSVVWRRLGGALISSLCVGGCLLAASPAGAQTITVVPADGSGTAIETGNNPIGGEYTATLNTAFSPAHVQPGDPFTYTAKLEVALPNGAPQPCTPGTTSQTTPYQSWAFSQIATGDNLLTDPSTATATVNSDYSNTETIQNVCPAQIFTSGPMAVAVSGAESQNLQPGCYQATTWEAGIYLPFGATEPQVHSISSTVGTLSVGDTPDCTKLSPGVVATAKTVAFAEDGSGTLALECQTTESCKGKAVIEAKVKQSGRTLYGSCHHCSKVASAHYSIPANSTGHVKLKLNKAGIKLLFRGNCRHCSKQQADKIRVLYPICKHCKVAGQVVITSSVNGARSTTPIKLERGNCRHCGKAPQRTRR
jgi:hypothetical protein